jgi:uncharacterized membrane protein YdbT with pleckstrin-like domain
VVGALLTTFFCLNLRLLLQIMNQEEDTKIAVKENNEIEKKIFSIGPTLMFVKFGYVLAIVGAFLLVILLYYFEKILDIKISILFSVFGGLAMLLIPAYYHFKRYMVNYTLTDSKVEIDEGFISRTTRNIPLRTIVDVTVSATIPQRMLGFGDLIIENANEADKQIKLKNINNPKNYADILLKQMRKLDQ